LNEGSRNVVVSFLQITMKHRDTRQYLTIREGGAESLWVFFLKTAGLPNYRQDFRHPAFFISSGGKKAGKEVILGSGPLE